jgi:hypothetical protein
VVKGEKKLYYRVIENMSKSDDQDNYFPLAIFGFN